MNDKITIKKATHRHTHIPDCSNVHRTKIINKINNAARAAAPSKTILRTVTSNESTEDCKLLPNRDANLQRIRRKKGASFAHIEPTKTIIFDIPEVFRMTEKGKPFVLRDTDTTFDLGDTKHRIIICTTLELLTHFSKSDIWMTDGTFKVVPKVFFQLFNFCGNIPGNSRMFPMVFVLMTGEFFKQLISN